MITTSMTRDTKIDGSDAMSLFDLLAVLRVGWKHVIGWGLLAGVGVATITLLGDRTWTSRTSLTPQQRRSNTPSALSGLAAQFGVGVPFSDGTQSVFFYAELIRSRELLREVVLAPYKAAEGGAVSLPPLLNVRDKDEAVRIDNAVRRLSQQLTVSADPKTNIVRLSVSLADPAVAQQVAKGILDRVNRFNLEKRKSQARAEREFAQRRVSETKSDMEQAENRLQAFLTQNRGFLSSSELKVKQDRLDRELALRQRLFNTLSETFEQARLEEVRDTPVITVLEAPELPAQPDRRFLALKTLLACVVGSVLAALLLLGVVVLRALIRSDPSGWARLLGRSRRAGSAPADTT